MKPIVGCRKPGALWTWTNIPRKFVWNSLTPEKEKVVVLAGASTRYIDKYMDCLVRIGWLVESPAWFGKSGSDQHKTLADVQKNLSKFTIVATCIDSLVNENPDKFIYTPGAFLMTRPSERKIYEKERLCSIILSGNDGFPGHLLRAEIRHNFGHMLDMLGRASRCRTFTRKTEAYADYLYSIVVENCQDSRYFTDKILDCLACGTIPIYWGSPRIGEFFDSKGIILFNTLEDLRKILSEIGLDDYMSRMPSIKNNLEAVKKYRLPDDALWEDVLKYYV